MKKILLSIILIFMLLEQYTLVNSVDGIDKSIHGKAKNEISSFGRLGQ